jgi:electron transport complex protein RnfG
MFESLEKTSVVKQKYLSIPDMIKIVSTLCIVFILVGGLITVVHYYTQPIIIGHELKKRAVLQDLAKMTELIKSVLPNAQSAEKIGNWSCHEKTADFFKVNKNGSVCGYAIISYGKGYSGLIETLVGIDENCRITGIQVLSQTETPGLGDKVLESDFTKQFIGCDISKLKVSTVGARDCIQGITGATISCRAVSEDAVKNALAFMQTVIKNSAAN